MPFQSAKQRAWMFANKPRMAKRWAREYGGRIVRRKRKKS